MNIQRNVKHDELIHNIALKHKGSANWKTKIELQQKQQQLQQQQQQQQQYYAFNLFVEEQSKPSATENIGW